MVLAELNETTLEPVKIDKVIERVLSFSVEARLCRDQLVIQKTYYLYL